MTAKLFNIRTEKEITLNELLMMVLDLQERAESMELQLKELPFTIAHYPESDFPARNTGT